MCYFHNYCPVNRLNQYSASHLSIKLVHDSSMDQNLVYLFIPLSPACKRNKIEGFYFLCLRANCQWSGEKVSGNCWVRG